MENLTQPEKQGRQKQILIGCLTILVLILGFRFYPFLADPKPGISEDADYKLETMVSGLEHPWGMAFLPDGRMLVTERPGRLRLISDGVLDPKLVSGLPKISAVGQGGLLDVVLHPGYAQNGWIYLSYSAEGDGGYGTHIGRGRLDGHRITDWEDIYQSRPKSRGGRHFGSRLVFDQNNYLYITMGERGLRKEAQNLASPNGTVLRLFDDGRIPRDNPFVETPGALPEIFSYGHRNAQGAAIHPETQELWINEHGPKGGDEINQIQAGTNYGWPVITYGKEYKTSRTIGEGTHKDGMAQPVLEWTPSIAPSGMMFYTGNAFPEWKGNLFVGALKYQLLVRLELSGTDVVKEHRMLDHAMGRIRDVRMGPDGLIYLLSDAANGKLARLVPLNN